MTRTGWLGNDDEPDGGFPEPGAVGGFTGFILAHKADPAAPSTLEQVLARAAQAPERGVPEPYDDDDRQAAMVMRGYRPGLSWDLSQKLADTVAELEGEWEKVERGQRRSAQVMRMHAAGQITAFQIPDALGDEGDEGRVARLERRADSLRRQIADMSAMIAPQQQRALDPLEAASRHGRQVLAEVTRELAAAAQPRRPERRPFVSRGRDAVRSEHCVWCTQEGLDDETAFLLHSDPERPLPVTTPEQAAQEAAQEESDRLVRQGFSRETADYAAMAVR
jgi:hypothetical protein